MRGATVLRGVLLIACIVLASCSSSSRAPQGNAGPIYAPAQYARTHRDGAPWWDVDVNSIPDAVPMPYYGPVKANPYSVLGKTYYPITDASHYRAVGTASWYGTKFHGEATANGERYDLYGMSAAHKTLPLPCYVRVTNLDNGKSVVLRVNDRGPFYSDRLIDLSFAAAKKLGYAEAGTARVRVEGIDPLQWWAQQGKPVPLQAPPQQVAQAPRQSALVSAAQSAAQPVEPYTPPPDQHAEPVAPAQLAAGQSAAAAPAGLYLQVGAFANPDAAQLLKDKLSLTLHAPVFVSPVVHNQQLLHRVRLGPIDSPDEAQRLQNSVRLANLGQPKLVRPD